MDGIRFLPAYGWYCPACGHLNLEPCGEDAEYCDIDEDDEGVEYDIEFIFPDIVVCDKCHKSFRTAE